MVIRELGKYYADELVFRGLSAAIAEKDHIGLVGANGIGKTTLLRILAGRESYDEGAIEQPKAQQIGFLEQVVLEETCTLEKYLEQAFTPILRTAEQLRQAELDMSKEDVMADSERLEQAMQSYAVLQQRFETMGGYDYRARLRNTCFGLGFAEDELTKPVRILSGGQKIRAQLARVLLEEPDLLLLDEPTNHLDVDAIEWLESYLQNYPRAFVVVSHDRFFLDKAVTRIWELRDRRFYQYRGNYSAYAVQRRQRDTQLEQDMQRQQEEIARIEAFVRKYGAGNRARQAKGMAKRLERIDRVDVPNDTPAIGFSFRPRRQSGYRVAELTEVSKRFDEPVLKDISAEVVRGDRIALVGPNGSGKTTLLRILADQLTYEGRIRLGVGVHRGYFSQEIRFSESHSVLEELYETHRMELGQLRSVLARFQFRGEDVFKPTNILSGGESNRLALAKLLLQRPNFLLLDEPTNHLDIYAREALEEALDEFGGTLIFVSHDRYFIDALASKLWILHDGSLEEFSGKYSEYRALQQERKQEDKEKRKKRQAPSAQLPSTNAKTKQRQMRHSLEEEILTLEAEKDKLEALLADTEVYQDPDRSRELVLDYERVQKRLSERYDQWGELVEEG